MHRIILAGFALLILVLGFGFARQWNPRLSYDALYFYYPNLESRKTDSNWAIRPFLLPASVEVPQADQAKPVYALALRVWDAAYRMISPEALQDRVYSDFLTLSFLLAFLSLYYLANKICGPLLAAWISGLTFLNPWAFTVIYFNGYTALSMVAFNLLLAWLFCDKRRPLAAGCLMAALMFTNQSYTVFAAGVLTVLLVGAVAWQKEHGLLLRFLAGIVISAVVVESAIWMAGYLSDELYSPMTVTFFNYLRRSLNERQEFALAFNQPIFLMVLWFTFGPLAFAFLLLPLYVLYRDGRKVFSDPPAYLKILMVLLLGLVLIHVRSGPKFSRSLFLFLPFISLCSLMGLSLLNPAALRKVIQVALVAGFSAMSFIGLKNLNSAFLSTRHAMIETVQDEGALYVENEETFLPFFEQVVDDLPKVKSALKKTGGLCSRLNSDRDHIFVLSGPNQMSVLSYGTHPMDHFELGPARDFMEFRQGVCPGFNWRATVVERLPFFAHYPLLTLEDPRETFRYTIMHAFGESDYLDGSGTNTLWRVSRL